MFERWLEVAVPPGRIATPVRRPIADSLKVRTVTRWVASHWEALLIVTLLVAAGLAHGINMQNFPYYETDEGTYMSQAWAVVHEGQLAPYTYWYDHAPLGWIQIAVWAVLTGGFHRFGTAVESGRVLMLLMQLGSTYTVYRIGRRVSGSIFAATLSTLFFALSAYGIYYHRRVLLDNIATFWMLVSIVLLVEKRVTLSQVWLSGLALGVSILSKEDTSFVFPALALLVFIRLDKSQRWFATIGWVTIVLSIVSTYFLFAILRGELFPTGTLLGGTTPHVSLLGTLEYQASRGSDGGVLNLNSIFWGTTRDWIRQAPGLVVGGTVAALLAILAFRWNRLLGILGLATLSLWAFMARGGIVIGFYLVPMLPLLALDVGVVLGLAGVGVRRLLAGRGILGRLIAYTTCIAIVAGCFASLAVGYTDPQLGFASDHFVLWNNDQAAAQRQSIRWVFQHLSPSDNIIIDNYMWTDLHDPADGQKPYRYANWHWKVDLDPAIRNNVFHGNWRTADYVITTPQMLSDIHTGHLTIVAAAIKHSTIIAHFDTGGWPIDVRRVNK